MKLKIYKNYLLITVLIWGVLYLWRPWFLGFYHDDWTLLIEPVLKNPAWSINRLHAFLKTQDTRMITAVFYWLSSSLNQSDPIKWQIYNIAITFITSLAIGTIGFKLAEQNHQTSEKKLLVFFLGFILWPILPWNTGASISSVISIFQLSIIFFCAGIYCFLKSSHHFVFYFLSFLSFALGHFVYEIFFFQFLTLPLLFFILKKTYKKLFLIMIAAQSVIFIFIKILGTPKKLNLKFISIYLDNIISLPNTLLSTIFKHSIPINKNLSFTLFLLCLFWIYKKIPRNTFYFILTFLIGMALSALPFSMASYHLNGIGYFSRTLIGVSFWFCLFSAFLFSYAPPKLTALFILLLSISTFAHSLDWKRSYQLQNQIIASIKNIDFDKLKPNSGIVIQDSPSEVNGVVVFGAAWDINSAFLVRYPKLREKKIITLPGCYLTKWNPPFISQHFSADEEALWRYEVSDVNWFKFTKN